MSRVRGSNHVVDQAATFNLKDNRGRPRMTFRLRQSTPPVCPPRRKYAPNYQNQIEAHSSRKGQQRGDERLSKTQARSSKPYDKHDKTKPTKSTPNGESRSRAKVNTSSSTAVSKRSSSAPTSRFADAFEPHIVARQFIDDNIELLHFDLMHDMDQIRLQYRNGTLLPRLTATEIGFELYDRLNLGLINWNGYGTPLVYRAHI
ncbi:hypothetical protein K525DRAFT_272070 [Schizophyllum commune Loenen D]|nr:hypothetical protein K525DRAFT_272070 [Schizophyllum commune Loenen D]